MEMELEIGDGYGFFFLILSIQLFQLNPPLCLKNILLEVFVCSSPLFVVKSIRNHPMIHQWKKSKTMLNSIRADWMATHNNPNYLYENVYERAFAWR